MAMAWASWASKLTPDTVLDMMMLSYFMSAG